MPEINGNNGEIKELTGREKSLANLRKFKPGESGNPSGRPKKKPITELYERLADDPLFAQQLENAIRKRLTSDRMVGQLELREMADRIEGKVSQKLDVELNVSLSERMRKALERVDE